MLYIVYYILLYILYIKIYYMLYIIYTVIYYMGEHGGVVVKALRYKPGGRGFNSRWCHWNFSVT